MNYFIICLTFLINFNAKASEFYNISENGKGISYLISGGGLQNSLSQSFGEIQLGISSHLFKTTTLSLGYDRFNPTDKDSSILRIDQQLGKFITLTAAYHQDNWYYMNAARKAKIIAARMKFGNSSTSHLAGTLGYYERSISQSWNLTPYEAFQFNSSDKEGWYILNATAAFSIGKLLTIVDFGNWKDFFLGTSDLWRLDITFKLRKSQNSQIDLIIGGDTSGLSGLTTQFINYHGYLCFLLF